MIEREIKSIISESMFLKNKNILDKLTTHERILQINYYFDTPDFQLNSLGNTLRVRQKENQLMLQYKYDKQYAGIQKICKEIEVAVQELPPYISSNEFPGKNIEADSLYKFVGTLFTERLDYIYDETNISLDKSYYLGKCDYEIEIEFRDYKKAEAVLKLLSIEKTESQEMGKYNRFVKELQRSENVNNEY